MSIFLKEIMNYHIYFIVGKDLEGDQDATMADFNLIPEPSTMAAPYIPGGYTRLLMGDDQDATMQTAVRKLHFHGVQE
jgi:hypothetical protein